MRFNVVLTFENIDEDGENDNMDDDMEDLPALNGDDDNEESAMEQVD